MVSEIFQHSDKLTALRGKHPQEWGVHWGFCEVHIRNGSIWEAELCDRALRQIEGSARYLLRRYCLFAGIRDSLSGCGHGSSRSRAYFVEDRDREHWSRLEERSAPRCAGQERKRAIKRNDLICRVRNGLWLMKKRHNIIGWMSFGSAKHTAFGSWLQVRPWKAVVVIWRNLNLEQLLLRIHKYLSVMKQLISNLLLANGDPGEKLIY